MADEFQEAVRKIQKGDEAGGRRLLQAYLASHPQNAKAWLWLATVDVTDAERIEHLKRALSIEPNNQTARKALDNLTRKITHASSSETWAPPSAAPAAPARPAAAPRPAGRPSMRTADWIASIIMFLGLIAVGIGSFVVDRVYRATADAFLTEGQLAAATVIDEVTYWRRGAVMYCKVNYQFMVSGTSYQKEDTENDLDACDKIAASGVVTIEYLASDPNTNRIPWKYPEDYGAPMIGPICGGFSFFSAFLLLVYMVVKARPAPKR
jgi:hypothetical protein